MSERECPTCYGTGWIERDAGYDEFGERDADADYCWRCNGKGVVKE